MNFWFANGIASLRQQPGKQTAQKRLLLLAIAFNLMLLCGFKYADFFIGASNTLLASEFALLNIALPLGISFFTLQQIAYQIDTYEGLTHEKKWLNYFLFVSFFPQLIAGPIVHHKKMMPQFSESGGRFNSQNFSIGLFIFAIGLFKKAVLGDSLAGIVDAGYSDPEALTMAEAWFTTLAFTFQIYFDFSGYTDMALGIAMMFNIKLPQNFNSPYKATGMIDFWTRWHMTLTSFITTYVYVPILRKFNSITLHKAMLATLITFTIVGFWHGPSWLFVVFGLAHGVGIVINHYWNKTGIRLPVGLSWLITFTYLNVAFILFRSDSWSTAETLFTKLFAVDSLTLPGYLNAWIGKAADPGADNSIVMSLSGSDLGIIGIALAAIIALVMKPTSEHANELRFDFRSAFLVSAMLFCSLMFLNNPTDFIYFDF